MSALEVSPDEPPPLVAVATEVSDPSAPSASAEPLAIVAIAEVSSEPPAKGDKPPRSAAKPWSPEEDDTLRKAIETAKAASETHQVQWTSIAGQIANRTGKQCRERWLNHLDPQIVPKSGWTPEEDTIINEGVAEMGTKWSEIVKRLPGRSDNSIKNRYYSNIRKEGRKAKREKAAAEAPAKAVRAPRVSAVPFVAGSDAPMPPVVTAEPKAKGRKRKKEAVAAVGEQKEGQEAAGSTSKSVVIKKTRLSILSTEESGAQTWLDGVAWRHDEEKDLHLVKYDKGEQDWRSLAEDEAAGKLKWL